MQYIYIFTNPAMPDWVKVGKTNDIKKRLDELSHKTAVPCPFECYAAMQVPDEQVFSIEHALHNLLGKANKKAKEFFRTTPEKVMEYFNDAMLLNPACKIVSLPELDDAETAAKVKGTTFEMLGIQPGTPLYYVFDDTFVCTTADNKNKVLYKGQESTLSGLAKNPLNYVAISGFKIFSLEPHGETLWDLRLRLKG